MISVAAAAQEQPNEMKVITTTIDAGKTAGNIKPLNDMCCGPVCLRGYHDFTSYYKELGVQYVRLHDIPYTFDAVQDINYVFPNMEADPEREESYNFGQTDFYINTITSEGMKVIYRLGYSIEFEKTPLVHNVPPASFDKWASICAHVVRHYNQGWANGKELGITYWEVWNEPDSPGFWAGSPESFYQLYEATAKAVKAVDPALKVGGPALAALKMDFLEGLLKYCQEHQTPLDFVSWHHYAWDAEDVAARAAQVRTLMDKYGFTKAESILDEWNFIPANYAELDRQGLFTQQAGMPGTAFDAAVLIRLQDAPVDIANFYTGTCLVYGLFNIYGTPHKAYYSFLAFRRMLDCPKRLAIDNPNQEGVYVLAGLSEDKTMVRVLASNTSPAARTIQFSLKNLPWADSSSCEKQVITTDHNLENISNREIPGADVAFTEEIAPLSVCLLTVRPTAK